MLFSTYLCKQKIELMDEKHSICKVYLVPKDWYENYKKENRETHISYDCYRSWPCAYIMGTRNRAKVMEWPPVRVTWQKRPSDWLPTHWGRFISLSRARFSFETIRHGLLAHQLSRWDISYHVYKVHLAICCQNVSLIFNNYFLNNTVIWYIN